MNKQDITRFFDERAALWDSIAELQPDKIETIFDAAGIREGDSVLDIACGTGILFPFYIERGVSRVDGVDIAPEMVSQCRAKFAEESRIHVVCGDAEELVFPCEYDRCMVFNAFPHFCSPELLLGNLYRAVKEGGTVTVAHDKGRKAIDAHHAGEASRISNGLMPSASLKDIFTACGYRTVSTVENDGIYIVIGIK